MPCDNAGWFPGTYPRAELLLDVTDRELWLTKKDKMMQMNEIYFDTRQAVSGDIARAVRTARPFIEQSAELTGMNNDAITEFLEWFKRFGGDDEIHQARPASRGSGFFVCKPPARYRLPGAARFLMRNAPVLILWGC